MVFSVAGCRPGGHEGVGDRDRFLTNGLKTKMNQDFALEQGTDPISPRFSVWIKGPRRLGRQHLKLQTIIITIVIIKLIKNNKLFNLETRRGLESVLLERECFGSGTERAFQQHDHKGTTEAAHARLSTIRQGRGKTTYILQTV